MKNVTAMLRAEEQQGSAIAALCEVERRLRLITEICFEARQRADDVCVLGEAFVLGEAIGLVEAINSIAGQARNKLQTARKTLEQ